MPIAIMSLKNKNTGQHRAGERGRVLVSHASSRHISPELVPISVIEFPRVTFLPLLPVTHVLVSVSVRQCARTVRKVVAPLTLSFY